MVEVVVLQPNLRTAEDIVGGETHLDVIVGWDEDIVDAVHPHAVLAPAARRVPVRAQQTRWQIEQP